MKRSVEINSAVMDAACACVSFAYKVGFDFGECYSPQVLKFVASLDPSADVSVDYIVECGIALCIRANTTGMYDNISAFKAAMAIVKYKTNKEHLDMRVVLEKRKKSANYYDAISYFEKHKLTEYTVISKSDDAYIFNFPEKDWEDMYRIQKSDKDSIFIMNGGLTPEDKKILFKAIGR